MARSNVVTPFTLEGVDGLLRREDSIDPRGTLRLTLLWTKGARNVGHGPAWRVTKYYHTAYFRQVVTRHAGCRFGYHWRRVDFDSLPPEFRALWELAQ